MKLWGSMAGCTATTTLIAAVLLVSRMAGVHGLDFTLYASIPVTVEAGGDWETGLFSPPVSGQPITWQPISGPPASDPPISTPPVSSPPIPTPPNTPPPPATTSVDILPNTFIGSTGLHIMTSLLEDDIPVLLWGVVRKADIDTACKLIVTRGELNINATINDMESGSSTYMMIHVVSVGGACLDVAGGTSNSGDDGTSAGDDSSELVVEVDSPIAQGRQALITCPASGAQEDALGCGVFIIGSDIESLYAQGNPGIEVVHSSALGRTPSDQLHAHRLDCQSGAAAGFIRGVITGVLASENCEALGPRLAPFCIAGVIGVYAMMGAYDGCISEDASRSACFPGDSVVFTRGSRSSKLMSELRLGDEVAVWRRNSGVGSGRAYAAIYAFGHNDANATAVFLEILVSPIGVLINNLDRDEYDGNVDNYNVGALLRISPMHFVPTLVRTTSTLQSKDVLAAHELISDGSSARVRMLYKRARDLVVGDVVRCANPQPVHHMAVVPCIVQDISMKKMQGLFNPYTMGCDTIIVDGVVASVHTQWFLDPLFDNLGITHLLPSSYQLIMSPIRLLYSVMGKDLYVSIYEWLDARIDVPTTAMNHGGTFVVSSILAILAGSSSILLFRRSK